MSLLRSAAGLAVALLLVGCTVVPNPDYDADLGGSAGTTDGSSDAATDTDSGPGGGGETQSTGSTGSPGSPGSDESTEGTGGTVIECAADPEPREQPCPAACDACEEGTCRIACVGDDTCKNEVVACPDGWPCEVTCADKHACQNATLLCPDAHACRVTCDGDHACERLALTCGDGTCDLDCGDEDTCKDAEVACGGDTSVTCGEHQNGLGLVESARTPCACAADDRCFENGEDGEGDGDDGDGDD